MTPDERARLLALVEQFNALEWCGVDEHVHGCCMLCLRFPVEGHDVGCDMAAFKSQLAALLPPVGQEEPQGWLPIETAPKDGTPILLARTQVMSGELIVVSGSWNSGGSMHMPHWMSAVLGFKPSHWLPLPDPPLSSKASPEGEEPPTIGQCTARHSSGPRCQLPWPHYGETHWSDGFYWPNSERPAVARTVAEVKRTAVEERKDNG